MRTKIVYEDETVLVVHKMAGMATESARLGEMDVVSELKNYVKSTVGENKVPYVGMVHRLDQPVEGLLVFGKTKEAASALCAQVAKAECGFLKRYEALVYGLVEKDIGTLTHYVKKLPGANKTSLRKAEGIKGKEERLASLSYEVIDREVDTTKLSVLLGTGRYHQIRAQLSSIGHPIMGDQKYGTEEAKVLARNLGLRQLQLFAVELEFIHPKTREVMHFHL